MNNSNELQNNFDVAKIATVMKHVRMASIPISHIFLPAGLSTTSSNNSNINEISSQIVFPILVCPEPDGTYRIIDGCKRFLFLKSQNHADCLCAVSSQALSDKEFGTLRILINRNNSLSLREQQDYLQWCIQYYPSTDIPALGMQCGIDPKTSRHLVNLTTCSIPVQNAVGNNAIHIENALDFEALTDDDRKAFLSCFALFKLSQQSEHEYIEWISEIAYAKSQSIADFLSSPAIQQFVNDASMNTPQKIQKIRNHLFTLRYPTYSTILDDWKTVSHKTFTNASKISVIPSMFFEKNKLEIRVTLTSSQEAIDVFSKLASIPKNTWESLITPVK